MNLGVCDWDDQLDIGVFLVIDSFSVIEKCGKKGLARSRRKYRNREAGNLSVGRPRMNPPRDDGRDISTVPLNSDSGRLFLGDVATVLLKEMGFHRMRSELHLCFVLRIDSPYRQCSVDTTTDEEEIKCDCLIKS